LSKLDDFLDSPLSSSPEIPCRSVAWFTEPPKPAMVTPLRENDHTNGIGLLEGYVKSGQLWTRGAVFNLKVDIQTRH